MGFNGLVNTIVLMEKSTNKEHFGEWWLFFGCRYKNGDYIYKDKLESAYNDKNGVLDELKIAFSRETDKKIYNSTIKKLEC